VASQHGVVTRAPVFPITYIGKRKESLRRLGQKLVCSFFDSRPSGFLVCVAGRFSREKGIHQVAHLVDEILVRHCDMQAVFAGSGPEEEQLRQRFIEHKDRVWIGALSFEETKALCQLTDLMIIGTGLDRGEEFAEAISSSVVHFSSAGSVILYFPNERSGGIHEAMSEPNREFCSDVALESAVDKVEQLLTDSELKERISTSNRLYGNRFLAKNSLRPFLRDLFSASLKPGSPRPRQDRPSRRQKLVA
jgi:glycosyltransferase involved in cell wall biosynthesis